MSDSEKEKEIARQQRELIDELKKDIDVAPFATILQKQADDGIDYNYKKHLLISTNSFALLLAVLLHKKILTKEEADAIVYGTIAVTEKTLEQVKEKK